MHENASTVHQEQRREVIGQVVGSVCVLESLLIAAKVFEGDCDVIMECEVVVFNLLCDSVAIQSLLVIMTAHQKLRSMEMSLIVLRSVLDHPIQ